MQAKQVLHKLLQKTCPEMHKKRRTALFVNVMAALHGEVLTVTHLARFGAAQRSVADPIRGGAHGEEQGET